MKLELITTKKYLPNPLRREINSVNKDQLMEWVEDRMQEQIYIYAAIVINGNIYCEYEV